VGEKQNSWRKDLESATVRSHAGSDRAVADTPGDRAIGSSQQRHPGRQQVGRRRGVARVAGYRAIFGGAGADRVSIRWTSDENLFTVS